MPYDLDESTQALVLDYVDSVVPGPCDDIWLTGSHAIGPAQPEDHWDVVAFTFAAAPERDELFRLNQSKEVAPGVVVDLVVAHPIHWGDSSHFMTHLRRIGLKLR